MRETRQLVLDVNRHSLERERRRSTAYSEGVGTNGRADALPVKHSTGGYRVTEVNKKAQSWSVPSIRRYGTFEAATQRYGCDKNLGATDGFTFQGQAIACGS